MECTKMDFTQRFPLLQAKFSAAKFHNLKVVQNVVPNRFTFFPLLNKGR